MSDGFTTDHGSGPIMERVRKYRQAREGKARYAH